MTRLPHGRSSGRYFIAVKAHPFATGGLCCFPEATITPVTYLIDGYNLLYAIGLANRNLPAKGLERARTRLLDWLADRMKGRDALIRVVFDAQNSPAPSSEYAHRGVRVRFAFRQTADELIEELIHAEPHPDRIAVVSNDNQVQDAARHRGCLVQKCEEFVDWLIAKPEPDPGGDAPVDDRPAASPATPDEMAAWLDVFSQPKKRPKK